MRSFAWMSLQVLAAVLSPERCAACDDPVPAATVFCRPCGLSVERAQTGSPDFAAFRYGGALARAILRFKYESRPDLARPLGSLLLRGLPVLPPPIDVVVPVPLHSRRLVVRGYNQAALLAGTVARYLRVPMAPRALLRARDTAHQAELGRANRASNVRDAFSVRQPRRVEGGRILLVDDVRTTGATLVSCSKELISAGAKDVQTLVIASASLCDSVLGIPNRISDHISEF